MELLDKMEEIVSFEDWSKLDLRVGEIVDIEKIEGADKLWKLVVDIGSEKRIVCAGIKEYYSKDELLGKKIVVIVNLAPRKMRGIESQGMVLAAVNGDESFVRLIQPDTLPSRSEGKGTSEKIENGAKVR